MPVIADRAEVGLATALDTGQQRGVEGVGLGAIPALAGAHALPLFLRGLFHLRFDRCFNRQSALMNANEK